MLALWRLRDGKKRFTELRRQMPGVTQKMLTQQLRQLEADGLISRKVYPEVPPKVEYQLTKTGEELSTLLVTLGKWATAHLPAIEAGRRAKDGEKGGGDASVSVSVSGEVTEWTEWTEFLRERDVF